MRSTLMSAVTGALAVGLLATPAFAEDDPNQGKEDFVLMVDNTKVSCASPVAGEKHEDGYGETITIWSSYPIDYVTVKSGKDAAVVSSMFWMEDGKYHAKITLTKDVSNYVVWTCPKTPPTTHTTPPTTHTTPPTTTKTTPPVTTTVTHPPSTTTVTHPPVTHTPPPAGGGYETPGVGAPDTGGAGAYTPLTLAAGTGLLLLSAGLLARGIRRREVDEG